MKYITTYKDYKLLLESFTEISDINKAIKIVKTNCSDWLHGMLNKTIKTHLYRGTHQSTIFSLSSNHRRRSATGAPIPQLLANLPSWKPFPNRNNSISLTTDNSGSSFVYDHMYYAIPFNKSKFGVCSAIDFNYTDSWPYLDNLVKHTFGGGGSNLILLHLLQKISVLAFYFSERYPEIYNQIVSTKNDNKLLLGWSNKSYLDDSEIREGLLMFGRLLLAIPYQSDITFSNLTASDKGKKMLYKLYVSSKYYELALKDKKKAGEYFLDFLNEILDPTKNEFSLVEYSPTFDISDKINNERNAIEVWTTNICLLVNDRYMKVFKDALHIG